MNHATPANTTGVSRSVARTIDPSSTAVATALADAFTMAQNVPQMVVTMLKSYTSDSSNPIGSTISLGSMTNVSTGATTNPTTANIGASQLKIVQTSTTATLYWSPTLTMDFGNGANAYPSQVKLVLSNFSTSGDPTTYQLAVAYINVQSPGTTGGSTAGTINEIIATNNLSTGKYEKYSPIEAGGSGEIFVSGRDSGGVYQYDILKGSSDGTPTIVGAFGTGSNVEIADNLVSGSPTSTFGSDATVYGSSTGLSTGWSDLTNGTVVNLATAASDYFNAYAATVTGWKNEFGTSGTFSSDLGDSTTWF